MRAQRKNFLKINLKVANKIYEDFLHVTSYLHRISTINVNLFTDLQFHVYTQQL